MSDAPSEAKNNTLRLEVSLAMAADIIDSRYDCEVFEVDMTKAYALTLIARMDAVKKLKKSLDRDTFEIYFWDYSGDYYKRDWDAEPKDSDPEDTDGVPIVKVDGPKSMECNQCIAREDEVCWTAIPKHSSVYVLTQEVGRSILEGFAR